MKRFTETTKWEDPWFRALSAEAKLLWFWLLDHCDISGVIRPDLQLASFQIGQAVDEQHIVALGDRVKRLPDGKFHIVKFVRFQFGTLSTKSNVHQSVMRSLEAHGLPLAYPSPTLGQPLTLDQPLPRGCPTPKEKEKVQAKEPVKEKERPMQNGIIDPPLDVIAEIVALYRRPKGSALTLMESAQLSDIIRERHRWRDEWAIIKTLKPKEPRYFPQSVSRLLSGWQEALDRANNHVEKEIPKDFKTAAAEAKQLAEIERRYKSI